jgi:hypothetical protein
MHRRLSVALASIIILGAAALGACGGATTAPTASPAASSAPPLTAAGLVAQYKAGGMPVSKVIVYSAATDPNDLLGRPNGYLSKAAFTDTRLKASEVASYSKGDVARGGSVEVFSDAASAKARMKYIQATLKAAPMLGTEYDYLLGAALVRVSGLLTPSQAVLYQTALLPSD